MSSSPRRARLLSAAALPAAAVGIALLLAAGGTLGMGRGVVLSQSARSFLYPWRGLETARPTTPPALTDPVWQFVPWWTFARAELAEGRLPLWNPHQDGGVPLLGNAQSALGSPLVWPALLLGVARGWNLVLLLKIAVALVGTYLWLRDAGRSRAASGLGAVAFALSGPFVAWLAHPHTLVAAPLPFVLLFARRVGKHPGARNLAGLVVSTAALLAGGHPETMLQAAVVAAALTLAEVSDPTRLRPVLGGAVLGALLAAPFLLTSLEYLGLSSAWRNAAGRHPVVLAARDVVRFVVSDSPSPNRIESAASVSLVVLALVPFGLRRERRAIAAGLLGAGAVTLVYDGPVARALATTTPIYWSRLLLLLPLPLSWLAASGLDRLVERAGARRRFAGALATALALLAAVQLIGEARGVHETSPADRLSSTTPLLERLRAEPGVFRVLPLWTFLPANTATTFGLDDVRGYDALSPAGWRRRRDADLGAFADSPGVVDTILPWALRRGGTGLDDWNVRYLILDPRFRFPVSQMNAGLGTDLVEVYAGPDGRILENRRAKARVRFESGGGVARVEERTPTRWRLDVETPTAARLVVANPFFPGWRVRVDGRPVRLDAEAGDPIAFDVAPGRHEVELRYLPASFVAGVGVAAFGFAASLFSCWRIRSRWRKSQAVGPSPVST